MDKHIKDRLAIIPFLLLRVVLLVLPLIALLSLNAWGAEQPAQPDPPEAASPDVLVVEVEDRVPMDDFSEYLHPWSSPESFKTSSTVSIYVPVYDNLDIGPGIGYEISAYYALYPPFAIGLSLSQSVSDVDESGALLDGSLHTAQMMYNGRLDIPLGKSWMPMLSFSAGIGFLHLDPKPATHLKNDLAALGLDLERDTQLMLNLCLKVELKIPLVRERNTFLILGVSREQAEGRIKYRHIDINTGQTVFEKSAYMEFNRTSFFLGLSLYF